MELSEPIRTRKSVREYHDRAVDDPTLRRIFDAARLAPSARNAQEWRFVVVRDRATRQRIAVEAARLMPLGYPRDPAPVAKSRLPVEEILHYERW